MGAVEKVDAIDVRFYLRRFRIKMSHAKKQSRDL